MKLFISICMILGLIGLVAAQDKSADKNKRKFDKPSKENNSAGKHRKQIPKPIDEGPVEIAIDDSHRVIQVYKNELRLTTNWVFVVDNSHSTWKIASRVISAFRAITLFPTDELRFCTYVFSNRGCHKYRSWQFASPKQFSLTEQFIKQNRGVNSYAALALRDALRQPQKELTVIIISDGGFSDGDSRAGSSYNQDIIRKIIEQNQQWRDNRGLGRAVIVAVGIENTLCWPRYPKDTNAVCMDGMRKIGLEGQGGFFYVQPLPEKTAAKPSKN